MFSSLKLFTPYFHCIAFQERKTEKVIIVEVPPTSMYCQMTEFKYSIPANGY